MELDNVSKIAICWPTDQDDDKIEKFAEEIRKNGKTLWGINWNAPRILASDFPIKGYLYYRGNIIAIANIVDFTEAALTSKNDLDLRPKETGYENEKWTYYLHLDKLERCKPFSHKLLEMWDESKTMPDTIQKFVYVKEIGTDSQFQCWIWSVTPENWEIVKAKNIWASKIGEKIREKIVSGDKVIFYVLGTGQFKGIFEFKGDWYDAKEPVWEDESDSVIYQSQIELTPLVFGDVNVYDIAGELSIFQNPEDKRLVNLVLKGSGGYPSNNGKPIPIEDYKKIYEIMEIKVNYWKISPGENGSDWENQKNKGLIAIHFFDFGDISQLSEEELREKIRQAYGKELTPAKQANTFGQMRDFMKIKEGDIIVANSGKSKILGIGRVAGPYHYRQGIRYPHTYPVDWYDTTEGTIPKQEAWMVTVVPLSKQEFDELMKFKTNYLLLRYNPRKNHNWTDTMGERYNFAKGLPNYTKIIPGSKTIWYDRDAGDYYYFGYGDVSNVEKQSDDNFYAQYEDFTFFKEPLQEPPSSNDIIPKKGSKSTQEKISRLPGWNNQISILPITKEIYDEIVNGKEQTQEIEIFEDHPLDAIPDDVIHQSYQELSEELLIPEKKVKEIINALVSGSHVILAGPIGTGKTELARKIPQIFWKKNGGYYSDIFTATADWNTQDVIGGIVPKMEDQRVIYKIQDGCVTESVRKNWQGDKRKSFEQYHGVWTIIDEFNRADIDKAFGQLFTALRTGDLKVPTDSMIENHEKIRIPKDYRIIGTLNTADKHYLFPLSNALKSRFAFIEIDIPDKDQFMQEIYYATKNAYKSLGVENSAELKLNHGTKIIEIGSNSAFYDTIYSAYNFLSYVREFKKLGTAILKIIIQNLITGTKMSPKLDDVLDNSINSTIIPQLEELSEMELGAIRAMTTKNIIPFLKEINKTSKRHTSNKVFSKTMKFLNLDPTKYEYFTQREVKDDDKLWSEINFNYEDRNKFVFKAFPTNLEQVNHTLDTLIEQTII